MIGNPKRPVPQQISKTFFEFVLLILLTYWVGNLSVVALGANVITNVEFYLIWGLVLFTFTL